MHGNAFKGISIMKTNLNGAVTSRRALLAGSGGVLLAGAALGVAGAGAGADGASPDAELIALCARFDVLQDKIYSYAYEGPDYIHDDDERTLAGEPLFAEQEDLLEEIFEIKAQTFAGFLARAKTYRYYDADRFERDHQGYWDQMMVFALIRDMDAYRG